MKRYRSFLAILLSFSVICTLFVSGSVFNTSANTTGTEPNYWDGTEAQSFAGGTGTKADPYLIENGGQLCKAINELGKSSGTNSYYLITADIYLNEGYENYENWGTDAPKNVWPYIVSNQYFIGYLDGGYHTVYGLYITSPKDKYGGGLICRLQGTNTNTTNNTRDWTATVCNLTVSNAYVAPFGTAGAVVGQMQGKSAVTNCVAKNVIATGRGSIGAVVGGMVRADGIEVGNTISNCAAYDFKLTDTYEKRVPGGIIGYANAGSSKLTNCFSAGMYPVGVKQVLATVTNCSTDNDNDGKGAKNGDDTSTYSTIAGITKRSTADMKGPGAVERMGLSADVWQDTEDYYPVLRKIWSGKADAVFAGGTGTKADPYLIENGGQLLKAINELGKSSGTNSYYLITADIYLNRNYANYSTWGTDANAPANVWPRVVFNTDNKTGGFEGYLDGGFHTVYGLYVNDDSGYRGGLICNLYSTSAAGLKATVCNLTVSNAYVAPKGTAGAVVGHMNNYSEVSNCVAKNVIAKGDGSIGAVVGAMTGAKNTISNCAAYDFELNDINSGRVPGGILGYANATESEISNCFSAGMYPVGVKQATIKTVTNCSTDNDDRGNGEKGAKDGDDKSTYNTIIGITKIDNSKMQGKGAVDNMGLSADVWKETAGFPTLRATGDNEMSHYVSGAYRVKDAEENTAIKLVSQVFMPGITKDNTTGIKVTVNGVEKTVKEVGLIISREGVDVTDISEVKNNPLTGYKAVGYQNGEVKAGAEIKSGYIKVSAVVNRDAAYVAKSYMIFTDDTIKISEPYAEAAIEDSTINNNGIAVEDKYPQGDVDFSKAIDLVDLFKMKKYAIDGYKNDIIMDILNTNGDDVFDIKDIEPVRQELLNPSVPLA